MFYCINYELTIRNLYSDIFYKEEGIIRILTRSNNETTIEFEAKGFSHLFICTSNILYIDYFFLIPIITNLIVPLINRNRRRKKDKHSFLPFSSNNEKDNIMTVDLEMFTNDSSDKSMYNSCNSIDHKDITTYPSFSNISSTEIGSDIKTITSQIQQQQPIEKKENSSSDIYKRKQTINNDLSSSSFSKKKRNEKKKKINKEQPIPIIGSLKKKSFNIHTKF